MRPWTGRASIVLPALLLCPPLGLYLLWRRTGWDAATRWSVVAGLLVFVAALTYPGEPPPVARTATPSVMQHVAGAPAIPTSPPAALTPEVGGDPGY